MYGVKLREAQVAAESLRHRALLPEIREV